MGERSKKIMTGGVTYGFWDEGGFSSTPFVHRTWAPVGVTPILTHPFNWTIVSAISVITTTGDLYFRLHPGKTIRSGEVVMFLHQLLRQVKGKIILYWDGLPAHRSKKVKKFIEQHPRLQIKRLPSYSPDLNPDEAVWSLTLPL
jgi:hypothetical protein